MAAVHSTRRIIWKATDGAIGNFSPSAAVTWRGFVAFNEQAPDEPPGTYVEGSAPAMFGTWEHRGAQNPQGHLGRVVANGQGAINYTIYCQMGAGPEWIEIVDEEIRTLLDAVDAGTTGVVYATEVVVDIAAGIVPEGWAAVTFAVPAQVIDDYT